MPRALSVIDDQISAASCWRATMIIIDGAIIAGMKTPLFISLALLAIIIIGDLKSFAP